MSPLWDPIDLYSGYAPSTPGMAPLLSYSTRLPLTLLALFYILFPQSSVHLHFTDLSPFLPMPRDCMYARSGGQVHIHVGAHV